MSKVKTSIIIWIAALCCAGTVGTGMAQARAQGGSQGCPGASQTAWKRALACWQRVAARERQVARENEEMWWLAAKEKDKAQGRVEELEDLPLGHRVREIAERGSWADLEGEVLAPALEGWKCGGERTTGGLLDTYTFWQEGYCR